MATLAGIDTTSPSSDDALFGVSRLTLSWFLRNAAAR